MRSSKLAATLVLTSCVSSAEFYQKATTTSQDKLRNVAAFDLKCPANEIKMTLIGGVWYEESAQAGVEGCGGRARYVKLRSTWVSDGFATANSPPTDASPAE
jgi:hypothetical protein